MGVYLPNIEIPTSCCQCPVNMEVCKRGYKYLLAHPELYDKRAKDCPLIEVHEPHGRLIDADALREDWLENGENEYVYDTNAFLDSLDDAPTIIEAEEGIK